MATGKMEGTSKPDSKTNEMSSVSEYLKDKLKKARLNEECLRLVETVVRKMNYTFECFSIPERRDERSKQLEHIINKGVLKVYYNIVNTFLQKCNFPSLSTVQQLREDLQVCKEIKNPFSVPSIKTNIQDKWKTDIPENEEYIQFNEKEYGTNIKSLVDLASNYMKSIHDGSEAFLIVQRNIREVLTKLTEHCLYIDPMALMFWLQKYPEGKDELENALSDVKRMFTRLNPCGTENVLNDWTYEISKTL